MTAIRSFDEREIQCNLTGSEIDELACMPQRDVAELANEVALEMEDTFDCVASVDKTDTDVTVRVIRSQEEDHDAVQLTLRERLYSIVNRNVSDTDQSRLGELST